jgi:hypothetical protein
LGRGRVLSNLNFCTVNHGILKVRKQKKKKKTGLGGYLICLITTSSTLKNNLENKEPAVLDFPKCSESEKLKFKLFGKCQNNARTS